MKSKIEALADYLQFSPHGITQVTKYRIQVHRWNMLEEYNVYTEEERFNELVSKIYDEIYLNGFTFKFNKFDASEYMKMWQIEEIFEEYIDGLYEEEYFDSYKNRFEWFANEIGLDTLGDYIEEGVLDFDFEKLANDIIKYGNPGDFLGIYDGKELKLSNNFFAYKMYQV